MAVATAVGQSILLGFGISFRVRVSTPPPPPPPPSHLKISNGHDVGSLASNFSGLKIRPTQLFSPRLSIVARRVCPFTGKKPNRANKISFSNQKTKRQQFVNLQYKRIWWEAGKRYLKLRLSTKALKTIEKNGLDEVAKKAGIDLRKK